MAERVREHAEPSAEEAAFSPATRSVRLLRLGLGAIWLLDAALQFQPYMFTKGFVRDVLVPSAGGNTGFVSDPTMSLARFIMPHVAIWNALFATVQLLLGTGIIAGVLIRRAALLRLTLLGSFLWSAMVWWLGEGVGGVLTGASPLSGAPGAAALYVVAGVLLWPGDHSPAPLLGGRFARGAWASLWALDALLLLEPSNQARDAVSSVISTTSSGEPSPIRSLLGAVAHALNGAGPWLDSLLALTMLVIGAAVALGLSPRTTLATSILLAAAIWVFGEAFGGILTGQATDPNSGPLLILLALCMWAGLGGEATSARSAVRVTVKSATRVVSRCL